MSALLKKTIWLFLFFGWQLLPAQHPFFLSHTLGEEFKETKISVVHEQRSGLLWFGADDGLFSYDGLTFQIFRRPDFLGETKVTAIGDDAGGLLWVGYEDGVICYLEKGRQLKIWQPEEGLPKAPVTGFAFPKSDIFWFSTYGEGLYCFSEKRLYNFNTADDGLSGDDIYTMAHTPDGRVWVGTDGGISICSFKEKQKKVKIINARNGLPDEIVRAILPDKKGNIWIGTFEKGVCYYDAQSGNVEFPLGNWHQGVINSLELFEDQELWIGTDGQGIYRWSLHTKKLYPLTGKKELKTAKIFDLHKDVEGNIWILSNDPEIYSGNRQFEISDARIPEIQAVFADKQDRVWVGTAHGLFRYEKDTLGNCFFRQELAHIPLNVTSIFEDAFGNLWIGTFGAGICCYRPESGKIRKLSVADGFIDGNIFSMAGIEDRIWLATLRGAMEVTVPPDIMAGGAIGVRVYDHTDGLGDFIYKVFVDSKGRVWFGTDGRGLGVLENNRINTYDNANGGAFDGVYAIAEDRRGHIWLGSSDRGIFEFDGHTFQPLSLPKRTKDKTITSLITDQKGNILIVHPSGIDLLDPESRHITNYDQEIGVKDIDPNLNAVSADNFGNIWVGTQNTLMRYTALSEDLEIHPRTIFQAVSVYLEQIDFLQKRNFAYDENYFTFNLIGLWYTDPSTVEYRYKLEGFDFDWKKTRDRVISYPHLPPGDYKFVVQSTENNAFVKEPALVYAFTIAQPFWLRWWFVSGCLLLAVALLIWFIKSREKRLQKETEMKKEKAESQLETLKSQINPHFLFNNFNTLITVIEENPKTAVEYVQALSDFYRSIMQYREKEVIPLEEELEILKSYSYLLQQRYGNNFQLLTDLNGARGYVVPLSLQMLVENAIKHNVISKAKPLTVEISKEPNGYVSVSNNLQLKMRPEASTGFGLQSIAKRYEFLVDRKVKIEKTESTFKVSIPLLENSG
ncbi:MAG TPA: two-component regulator propeller domain-containing protein [Saprospiraceae bacterium]|nr:two-component regulator propeller domain-containing protein [Saprospiraceae bacterium]